MRTPSTSWKPSRAALPVSPEVAVRMRMSFSMPLTVFAAVSSWGSMDRATSLKAEVGPRNSSSTPKSPTGTVGVRSSVSNLPVYARFTSSGISGISGSRAERIFVDISIELPFRQAFQSKAGKLSGIYRPPSGARPCRTAVALSTLGLWPRVE